MPSFYGTEPVPPALARIKFLALVLALSAILAGCSELRNSIAGVQVTSCVAYYDDKTPKEVFDAQRPRIRRLWWLNTQVGGARLITEPHSKPMLARR